MRRRQLCVCGERVIICDGEVGVVLESVRV